MKSKFILLTAAFLSIMPYTDKNPSKKIPNNFHLTKEEQFEIINGLNTLIKNTKYERDSIGSIKDNIYFDFSDFKFKKEKDTIRVDYWQSPSETIKLGKGDCEDKAILLNDLLGKKGLETKLFFGKVNPSRRYHVWQEIKIENKNYILESSTSIIIYSRDSLNENQEYIKIEKDREIRNKILEYEKRNGVKLNF